MNHKQARVKRLLKDIRQQDAAEKIGVSRSRLSMYERHNYPLPGGAEKKLERVLLGDAGA